MGWHVEQQGLGWLEGTDCSAAAGRGVLEAQLRDDLILENCRKFDGEELVLGKEMV